MRRLTLAKTAAASMDKKVAEAAQAKTENAQFQNLGQHFDPRQTAVMQGGVGPDFSALMTGEGTEQKNKLRQDAMNMIADKIEKGTDPTDAFNQIMSAMSGQTMTAADIGAEAQSEQNLALTLAQTQKAQAGTGAAHALRDQRDLTVPTAAKPPNMEALGTLEQGLLYANPETIPIERDAPGLFTGDITENLPFTDPRAQEVWAGMSKDQKAGLMRDFAPEFMAWRMSKQATDPRVNDAQMATALFLEEKGLAGAGAAPVAGAGGGPAPITPSIKYVRDANGNLVVSQ